MRDPKRIDLILDIIRTIWVAEPDLRLMQLLGNVYDSGREYYIEDDDLALALMNCYQPKSSTTHTEGVPTDGSQAG